VFNKYKLNEKFDSLTLSADVGSLKDSKEIFEDALNKLNINSEEAIFIDNTEKNLIIPGLKIFWLQSVRPWEAVARSSSISAENCHLHCIFTKPGKTFLIFRQSAGIS